jgi:hypothetical protein
MKRSDTCNIPAYYQLFGLRSINGTLELTLYMHDPIWLEIRVQYAGKHRVF